MLNYANDALQAIITKQLTAKEARIKITEAYTNQIEAMRDDPLWAQNEPALTTTTLSFTTLLADKLIEALGHEARLPKNFSSRLWVNAVASQPDHSNIIFYLANETANQELFSITDPLAAGAKLAASNLPTLLQVTAADDDQVQFEDDEITSLSAIIKALYNADYSFASVDETVLQPVNGLTFTPRYHNVSTLATTATVKEPGSFQLSLALQGGNVIEYHVFDDQGHDWQDLGTDDTQDDTFSWASTTIPEDLVDHPLNLQVTVRASENVPALDELFVIASNNAILMKQGVNGNYVLELPNHNSLTVRIDPTTDQIRLEYPEKDVQLMELNNQYPFIGEWLKAVLPQKRAFN